MTKLRVFLYRLISLIYSILIERKQTKTKDNLKIEDYFSQHNHTNIYLKDSVLIYAATIGELKAASFFLKEIQQKWPEMRLILVPGQPQYTKAFADIYPDAKVMHQFPYNPVLVDQFFCNNPIKYCVFIEGPSLHGYFPIRQELSLSVGCLSHNAPIVIINACLYKKQIHSRIDLIEHKLFSGLFRKAVKHWYAPNAEIGKDLETHNISKDDITIAGDIKFDNVFSDYFQPCDHEINEYFQKISGKNRLIVAGSVNALEEQKALIFAWKHIQTSFPDIVLVIAPRYVNDKTMMAKLTNFLNDQGIDYATRSEGINAISSKKLIVVDTFGELPCFYQQAAIAFAGRGHGVLEPMKYSKPVVVGPHEYWTKENSTSYLLYQQMRDNQALIECSSYDDLGEIFLTILKDRQFGEVYVQRYTHIIREKMGASEKIIEHMSKLLNLQPSPNQVVKPDNTAKAVETINHR
jgi:3-deoxy-D-manno-octulosonic-acid transferase